MSEEKIVNTESETTQPTAENPAEDVGIPEPQEP